jgi:hypothetical protein
MFDSEIRKKILSRALELLKTREKLVLWDDPRVLNYSTGMDFLQSRMSPEGSEAAMAIFKSTGASVLAHLFNSFASFREEKSNNAVNFFSSGFSRGLSKDGPRISHEENLSLQKYFATFSIFNSRIDSVYYSSNTDLFILSVSLFFRSLLVEKLLRGGDFDVALSEVVDKYYLYEKNSDVDKIFKDMLIESLSHNFRGTFSPKSQ